jgi:hypothetical protein
LCSKAVAGPLPLRWREGCDFVAKGGIQLNSCSVGRVTKTVPLRNPLLL